MSDNLGKSVIKTTSNLCGKLPTSEQPILGNKDFLTMAASSTYIDPDFLKLMKAVPFHYIVEVGARYGDESILLSRQFQNAKVYSFECNPATVEVCMKALYNQPNITFFNYALGAQPAEKPFYSYTEGNDGASSLLKRCDFHQTQRETGIIKVRTLKDVMIEQQIPYIDYLCMDVQGYELEVLKGLGKSLQTHVRYICLECPALAPPDGFLAPGTYSKYVGAPSYKDIEAFMVANGFVKLSEKAENYIEVNQLWCNKDYASCSWLI
jgi:FkbM family methyltransferase